MLTAHNAHFDHGFVMSAAERNGVKRNPFHPFTVLDTASLAAVAYGHTVLSEACSRGGHRIRRGPRPRRALRRRGYRQTVLPYCQRLGKRAIATAGARRLQ